MRRKKGSERTEENDYINNKDCATLIGRELQGREHARLKLRRVFEDS